MTRIYCDYAAATPLDPRVKAAMLPFFDVDFGNPSSVHAEGRAARAAVEHARMTVAGVLGAHADEVVFTNGVTEAVNMALLGVPRGHVVAVQTEHQAVLRTLAANESDVTFVSVDREGGIDVDAVMAAMRPDTVLVTVMYANNETGVVAPIAEIGKRVQKLRRETGSQYPLLHTDAAQAACFLTLDVAALNVDLMSLSGQKMYGPKGTGALYVRRGVILKPILFGGRQERALRPGTENVPGIVGFASALVIAQEEREAFSARMTALRDAFWTSITETIPGAIRNGPEKQLANLLNFSLPNIDGEAVIIYLDQKGIAAATSSSCTAGSGVSHVLTAMHVPEERVAGSIRFTLGRGNTAADVPVIVAALKEVVGLLQDR